MLTEPCKITQAKRKCNYGLSPTETEETKKMAHDQVKCIQWNKRMITNSDQLAFMQAKEEFQIIC